MASSRDAKSSYDNAIVYTAPAVRAQLLRLKSVGRAGVSSPFRVSVCAARTLNATGQPRVTLSLQKEHLRVVCGSCQEERSLTFAQKHDPCSLRGAFMDASPLA